MKIFNIKNKKYYEERIKELRDLLYRSVDKESGLHKQIECLYIENSELKSANKRLQKKYHDLMIQHTELVRKVLDTIDEKGTKMKCKGKEVNVKGAVYNVASERISACNFTVICTNDEKGKTLSIDNGLLQFTIPFEDVEEYFKGDYQK